MKIIMINFIDWILLYSIGCNEILRCMIFDTLVKVIIDTIFASHIQYKMWGCKLNKKLIQIIMIN